MLLPLHRSIIILTLIAAAVMLAGCSRKPMVAVGIDSAPLFNDDLDRESLTNSVLSNLDYLRTQPQEKPIRVADRTLPLSRLTNSLELFLEILAANPSPPELDRLVRQHFDIFQATGVKGFNPGRRMLITGYFQPVLEGSLSRTPPFVYPLYSVPDDLVRAKKPGGGGSTFSRLENGKPVPYWSRMEIEKDNRAAGYELVWLQDPFDAFVLHVQGSGLIRLRDGTVRGVHYAAKNGLKYRSIGKLLVDTGRMSLEEASLDTIRQYIASHPDERDAILHHNPSFIFFDWTQTHGAIGNLGRELTAGRSIAVDQNCFPAGSLAFLVSRKPEKTANGIISWNPLQRFVVVQDSGSAIRGPGRVDLFWGTGSQAGFEAGQMKEPGTLFFLISKKETQTKIAQN